MENHREEMPMAGLHDGPMTELLKQPHERETFTSFRTFGRPARRCQAISKSSGQQCKSAAMKGKNTCRIHGSRSPGAPLFNTNALVHGQFSRSVLDQKKELNEEFRILKADIAYITGEAVVHLREQEAREAEAQEQEQRAEKARESRTAEKLKPAWNALAKATKEMNTLAEAGKLPGQAFDPQGGIRNKAEGTEDSVAPLVFE